MDGFVDGVAYYNEAEEQGRQGRRLGRGQRRTATFTGGFAAGVEAKTAAQGLLDQNADVLLPGRWPDLPERRRGDPATRAATSP